METTVEKRLRAEGSCTRFGGTAVFFPLSDDGNKPGPKSRHLFEPAKMICKGCPVLKECKEYAYDTEQPDGVWGGEDPWDRGVMRQNGTCMKMKRGTSKI